MSTAARRRLVRDFTKMRKDPVSGVSAAPIDGNIMQWQAVIFGWGVRGRGRLPGRCVAPVRALRAQS